MFKAARLALFGLCGVMLAACASSNDVPRVVQAKPGMEEIRLVSGMATQIEIPNNARVQSITVGNPELVSTERGDGIVNLMPKNGTGETNIIVRSVDDEGRSKVYQYRLIIQPQ